MKLKRKTVVAVLLIFAVLLWAMPAAALAGEDSVYVNGFCAHCNEDCQGEQVFENAVTATCKASGSYDKVVYCSVCGEEMSRTQIVIGKLLHIPGEAVQENVKIASCKASGSYDKVVYCSVCGEEMSRTQIVIGKLLHIPGEMVRENEIEPAVATQGSYDAVRYCIRCGAEASRFAVATFGAAENETVTMRIEMGTDSGDIVVNGETFNSDVIPFAVDDHILVPVRVITELLGGKVDWNDTTESVTLGIDDKVLSIAIGQEIPGYDTRAMIINNRTCVSLCYIADALGFRAEWIAATQQIIIEK